MNLYAFVHNDPLTHLDLYGLLLMPTTSSTTASMMRKANEQIEVQKFLAGTYNVDNNYLLYDPGLRAPSLGNKPKGEIFFFSGIRTEF